jgi:hypothetical protein
MLAHPYECDSLTDREVFDKSHIHQASSARRLVIEAINHPDVSSRTIEAAIRL